MIQMEVTIRGNAAMLQRIRNGLSDRKQMHARLAITAENFTKEHVSGLNEHRTANRLGASPTGHLAKAAGGIDSTSDAEGASLRFPRASRLRAAFGEYTVRPGSGRKYLTIPAHRLTYGKRVGEISEPMFFKIVGGRHKALCFQNGSLAGNVAYWLREQVTIPEDRNLVPFDGLKQLARRVCENYVRSLAKPSAGGQA